jgi:glyceraldehyde-3-phosphate dehydrogenase (NAD(P))
MERKIVHVVGTGTIGEPLIGLLCDYRDQLGIDEVTFNKNSPLRSDRSKVIDLLKRGARLAVGEDKVEGFKVLGMDPKLETEEAIGRASVVIDCTPSGVGHQNKERYYHKFDDKVKGFMAQGSEDGFGVKYARGINDSVLKNGDNQFIQVVSCNTHNISCITNTLALDGHGPENLKEGRFVCVRRANDTSQAGGFIPAPAVGGHSDEMFGSHHAKDASELFATLGYELNLFSSAMKVNSQYMHVLWFALKTKEPTNLNEVKDRLAANDLVAMTTKNMTSTVYSFGRDHGHFGRILNQTVVVEQSLHVRNEHEIYGFCFTPQDGNSILSSISAAERFLYPHSYEDKIQCLNELFFDEI